MTRREKAMSILDSCINAVCESCQCYTDCEWEPNQGLENVRAYIISLEQNWNAVKWAVLCKIDNETETGKAMESLFDLMKKLEGRK